MNKKKPLKRQLLSAKFSQGISNLIQRSGMVFVLIIVMLLMSFVSPKFLTPMNLRNILIQNCIISIVAMGISFVLISGGIDLSIGSIIGTVAVLTCGLVQFDGFHEWQALLVSLMVAILIGIINGWIIVTFKLEPVVVTLGMLYIVRGLFQSYVLSRVPTSPQFTSFLGGESIYGIPIILFITIIIAIITHLILTKSVIGRWAFAMGGNVVAARFSGVPIKKARIIFYILSALYGFIAAVLLAGRIHAVDSNTGANMEFLSAAAAVVGGTSLYGGKGNALNAIVGALIMGVIANGLDLTKLVHFWQQVAVGAAIILAVAIDSIKRSHS